MYKYIITTTLFFSSLFLFSNSYSCVKDTSKKSTSIDTNYIKDYSNYLNIKIATLARSNTFEITDITTGHALRYSINTATNIGIGASYRFLSFEIMFRPKAFNNDNILYGKSQAFSLSFKANMKKFIIDAYLMQNKGFYTTDKYNFTGDTTQLPDHVRRPDIVNYNIGFNFLYVFNHIKYSSAAPFSLTQKQLKSKGSWLLGAYSLLYSVTADSTIFPDTLAVNFKPEVQFKSAGSFTFGISGGYTHTFVIKKKWYLNFALVPGISVQGLRTQNGYTGTQYRSSDLGLSLHSRFAFGVNKEKYFWGLSAASTNFLISGSPASQINYKFGFIRLYYGRRFKIKNKKVDDKLTELENKF